jgi:SWI/SNF-related matrix-associated actin-dependent regulator of chromatin subfamily A member 5
MSRFDWFLKSRTPDELKRRGQTLLLCLMKEPMDEEKPKGGAKGKVRSVLHVHLCLLAPTLV